MKQFVISVRNGPLLVGKTADKSRLDKRLISAPCRITERGRRCGIAWSGPSEALCDDLQDLFAVKAAVLDKDCSGVHAGERAAGHEEARHVGLEGFGVVDRPLAVV